MTCPGFNCSAEILSSEIRSLVILMIADFACLTQCACQLPNSVYKSYIRQRNIDCAARLNDTLSDPHMLKWLVDANVKKCPKCFVLVQRSEGCDDMLCKCGNRFDWSSRGTSLNPRAKPRAMLTLDEYEEQQRQQRAAAPSLNRLQAPIEATEELQAPVEATEELQAPIEATEELQAPMEATEVCRMFRNTGRCRFGDACKYIHLDGETDQHSKLEDDEMQGGHELIQLSQDLEFQLMQPAAPRRSRNRQPRNSTNHVRHAKIELSDMAAFPVVGDEAAGAC